MHDHRLLAGAAEKDYTVLSVSVLTLGLILAVELIRHRIDHAATGKFFFKTVLDGVYREREYAEERMNKEWIYQSVYFDTDADADLSQY